MVDEAVIKVLTTKVRITSGGFDIKDTFGDQKETTIHFGKTHLVVLPL
jgi:hypothetical protein